MSNKPPGPFAVYCAPPEYEKPPDSLHQFLNEIKFPSENDQSCRNDLKAIHRKLQSFQVLILSKHYIGYSNPVLKDALGDEFQGHDDVSEGEL
ncbi:hypothetical protein BT96DRAFT_995916 [Gymnopus androsaceus JB14]|uniref:Uncharacterized protein n=1 Tax=Gymnopus androsaceus JB14 TaxID=1447944 RepID=A0A6A4HIQ2_9AGAR|nr:hypothetical protein BT96DRAFT_995916 [Gymnopus androsaceus JB14]